MLKKPGRCSAVSQDGSHPIASEGSGFNRPKAESTAVASMPCSKTSLRAAPPRLADALQMLASDFVLSSCTGCLPWARKGAEWIWL